MPVDGIQFFYKNLSVQQIWNTLNKNFIICKGLKHE